MSKADELLEQMEQNIELYADSEEYCMLESDTSRVVVVPDKYRVFGVEGDTNVERIRFKFPKIVGDNVDLTTLNLRVNFQNADGKLDKYPVDDVEEAEEGYITFSWVIQDGLTPKKGQISFVVQALKDTSEGTTERKWSTTLNKIGQILEGLEVDETIAEQNPDIIEAILTRLDELEKSGGGSGTPGKDGREIELQNNGIAIQWRYVGDDAWTDLVQLSDITGSDGKAATIRVGIVSTGEPGTQASVENTGTEIDAVFNFVIPKGRDGEKGDPGATGATPNIQIGTVQTLEPGQQATASMSGTPENPLLNLGIPKGEKGDPGEDAESGSSATPRQEMSSSDTMVTLEPNKLYVFPEMSSLTVSLRTPSDANVANEYHFFFISGATATTLVLNDVLSDAYSIEANVKYEVSILEGVAYIKGVAINEA